MEKNNEPKKEQKYLVVKLDDLKEFVLAPESATQNKRVMLDNFDAVLLGVNKIRREKGKKLNRYVVVNQDEPYAEKVWQLILDGERQKHGGGVDRHSSQG